MTTPQPTQSAPIPPTAPRTDSSDREPRPPAPTTPDGVSPTERQLGAIFTKRWVAELVLDLAGYVSDTPLYEHTVVEPACGHGAFLDVIVERLLTACILDGVDPRDTGSAIVAMDLDHRAAATSHALVTRRLVEAGLNERDAARLASTWVRAGDFLLEADEMTPARWVVGNPPYVRIEDVPRPVMAAYRERWTTMSGRADVYVGFFEAGLNLLEAEGRLSFICADRWMRNRYGAALRALVEDRFAVKTSIVMHSVDAFEDRVSAYPAITVLAATQQADALVVDATDGFDADSAARLMKVERRGPAPIAVDGTFRASWLDKWARGAASWPDGPPERLALLASLESRFPTLAETDAFVSVGVATGADEVFVVDRADIVDDGYAFPTLAARETASGHIEWRGRYLVTPWTSDGLVGLSDAPKLSRFLKRNRARLEQRHVAKKAPDRWWRTIDRIDPAIARVPKLLIPDLKDRIHPVLDEGTFIPLHSLYYVTSERWDLQVLGGLLMSDIANMFVEAYSVKMANGYMRVSAQYLRRVRVPEPERLSEPVQQMFRTAFNTRDRSMANAAAAEAYGIQATAFTEA